MFPRLPVSTWTLGVGALLLAPMLMSMSSASAATKAPPSIDPRAWQHQITGSKPPGWASTAVTCLYPLTGVISPTVRNKNLPGKNKDGTPRTAWFVDFPAARVFPNNLVTEVTVTYTFTAGLPTTRIFNFDLN